MKSIRRGSFSSVDQLEDAIYGCPLHHGVKPKPFVLRKTAKDIINRESRTFDGF